MTPTTSIANTGVYFDTPSSFFGEFKDAYSSVKRHVFKLETLQSYDESSSPSYNAWMDRRFEESKRLLEEERQCDVPLYENLKKRNVIFKRCRPVLIPLTQYLQWEVLGYHFNSRHLEQIFFFDDSIFQIQFSKYAHHDFMIFDNTIAFIHNYDEVGKIQGGWKILSPVAIKELTDLYMKLFEHSSPYMDYLNKNGLFVTES